MCTLMKCHAMICRVMNCQWNLRDSVSFWLTPIHLSRPDDVDDDDDDEEGQLKVTLTSGMSQYVNKEKEMIAQTPLTL